MVAADAREAGDLHRAEAIIEAVEVRRVVEDLREGGAATAIVVEHEGVAHARVVDREAQRGGALGQHAQVDAGVIAAVAEGLALAAVVGAVAQLHAVEPVYFQGTNVIAMGVVELRLVALDVGGVARVVGLAVEDHMVVADVVALEVDRLRAVGPAGVGEVVLPGPESLARLPAVRPVAQLDAVVGRDDEREDDLGIE